MLFYHPIKPIHRYYWCEHQVNTTWKRQRYTGRYNLSWIIYQVWPIYSHWISIARSTAIAYQIYNGIKKSLHIHRFYKLLSAFGELWVLRIIRILREWLKNIEFLNAKTRQMRVKNSINERIYSMNENRRWRYQVLRIVENLISLLRISFCPRRFVTCLSSGICNPRVDKCGYPIRAGQRPAVNSPVDCKSTGTGIHKDRASTDSCQPFLGQH